MSHGGNASSDDQKEFVRILLSCAIRPRSLQILRTAGNYVVYVLHCGGAEAIPVWRKLRACTSLTGHFPVLLGGDDALAHHKGVLELTGYKSPIEILEAARAIDPEAWLNRRLTHHYAALKASPDEHLRSGWPSNARPITDFYIPYHYLRGLPLPSVYIGLLPTTESWEAPAFLRYGGWNECPYPEEQASVFRRWEGLYGAEVVGMADDVVELQVGRPPATREEALALAFEHYAYCSDRVEQGAGSIEALAAELLVSPIWFFWWD